MGAAAGKGASGDGAAAAAVVQKAAGTPAASALAENSRSVP